MKAEDLMIGDWVFHFGEIAQIVGIRIDNNNSLYFKTNLHDTWYESGVDGIEPITLTQEKDSVYNVHELQHALKLCEIEKEIVL